MPNDNGALPAIAAAADVTPAGFQSAAAFKLLYRAGELLAATELVPSAYQGKPADCALIVEIANRINASPLMVANNLDIIHGRPSWRSVFLIASVNRCGRFSALRYEWRGKQGEGEWGCRAWARELSTGDRLDGVWIDWRLVQAEGWAKKAGSKWLTMPQQMFVYRAAAFWTRAYAPDIALGFPSSDEMHDVIDVEPMRVTSSVSGSMVDKARAAVRTVIDATTGEVTERDASAAPAPSADQRPPLALDGNPPAITFATVMDAINRSESAEILDLARDMIEEIDDAQQRAELDVAERKRRKELAK